MDLMSFLSDDEWEVVKEPLDMEGTGNLNHGCLVLGFKCLSPTFCYNAINAVTELLSFLVVLSALRQSSVIEGGTIKLSMVLQAICLRNLIVRHSSLISIEQLTS